MDSYTHTHTDPENTVPTAPQSPALTHRHTCKTPKPTTLSSPPEPSVHADVHPDSAGWLHTPWRGPWKRRAWPKGRARKWFWALAFIRVWNATEQGIQRL